MEHTTTPTSRATAGSYVATVNHTAGGHPMTEGTVVDDPYAAQARSGRAAGPPPISTGWGGEALCWKMVALLATAGGRTEGSGIR